MNIRCLPTGPMRANCYIVWGENDIDCAVIDPGWDAVLIQDLIDEEELRLRHIFLTHLHYDHVGAVDALRTPETMVWYCKAEIENGGAAMARGMMDFSLPMTDYDEGDEIEVGSLRFRVLRTPGHSFGSVTLYSSGCLFTGDTLFAGSVGRTDLPGGNADWLANSLRRLTSMDPRMSIFPGHGGPSTLDIEIHKNPFLGDIL